MKSKKAKIIIIIVAVLVVVAAAVVGIVGYNAGWFGGEKEPELKQVYDESGSYVVRDEYYNSEDRLEYVVIKGYSDTEHKKLSRETYKSGEDKLMKIVHYNDGGQISSVDEYNGEIPQPVVHREYANGEPTGSYFTYEYTDGGDILKSIEYDANNEIVKTVKREYNDKGAITLYLETGKEGNQIAKTVYEYNNEGQESVVTFYDGDGVTGYVEYEYSKDGKRTKMSEYVGGELSSYRTYTYDENGTAQETIHYPDEK
ncbi:MAG: hypothetical protein IJZ57_07985 [Clostridia bacterium]|nr:hypothetical protein [Clostridia bacterium]